MESSNFTRFRREYKRFDLDAHAALLLDRNTKKALRLQDISARGLCVATDVALNLEQEVEIILLDPFFESPLTKKARVAWCREKSSNSWEAGLDFGMDGKIDLSEYVKNHPINNSLNSPRKR